MDCWGAGVGVLAEEVEPEVMAVGWLGACGFICFSLV